MTLTTVQKPIDRDRFGRPYVIPPTGGNPTPYTRCTTYVGGIEDTFKLGQWQQRHVALGLATNPDLIDAVRQSDLDDRNRLNELCDEAKNRAGAGDSARIGTYLHACTEAVDRGEDWTTVPLPELAYPRARSDFAADVEAYRAATAELKPVMIEQFCVLDSLKIGGTPDRVVRFKGKRYIADLKTGSIEWGALKIAAQLAVYTRSSVYNIETGERTIHGAEVDRGIVIHLPAGSGTCTLYWVDLLAGWRAVIVSRDIREQRTRKFKALMNPITDPVQVGPIDPSTLPTVPVSDGEPLLEAGPAPTLADQITDASDRDQITDLWRRFASEWNDSLTALAKERITQLGK